jgi:Lamin Tail Domain
MAANAATLRDEDGDAEDWIELYNAGDTVVNLGGWFLTDSAASLTKWPFPSTNLAPNQFLIVFASNKDRRHGILPDLSTTGERHQLRAAGLGLRVARARPRCGG